MVVGTVHSPYAGGLLVLDDISTEGAYGQSTEEVEATESRPMGMGRLMCQVEFNASYELAEAKCMLRSRWKKIDRDHFRMIALECHKRTRRRYPIAVESHDREWRLHLDGGLAQDQASQVSCHEVFALTVDCIMTRQRRRQHATMQPTKLVKTSCSQEVIISMRSSNI